VIVYAVIDDALSPDRGVVVVEDPGRHGVQGAARPYSFTAHCGATLEPCSTEVIRGSSMKDDADDAIGVAHFKIVKESNRRFHWELFNPHGTPLGRAMESFDTEEEAVANAELARRLIGHVPIKR
jgi:hypothetical protein